MNPLLIKQNDQELIMLLKASTVAYLKAKYWEIRITYFLIALAIAYPIAYVILQNEIVKLFLFGCSFGLTVFVQLFYDTLKGNTSKGALFKEEFDVLLFELPWKSTLNKLDRKEILNLAKQYKGDEIKDWYSNNLSASIEHNMAVAIFQYSNTSWDIELRKSYRKLLINFLVFYSVILIAFLFILKIDGITIFLLLFSILSFYTHFFSLIREHKENIDKRESISIHLDKFIRNRKYISTDELRDIQDEIYITRQVGAKVPNFYFRWQKEQLNSEIEKYIAEVNNLYKN